MKINRELDQAREERWTQAFVQYQIKHLTKERQHLERKRSLRSLSSWEERRANSIPRELVVLMQRMHEELSFGVNQMAFNEHSDGHAANA